MPRWTRKARFVALLLVLSCLIYVHLRHGLDDEPRAENEGSIEVEASWIARQLCRWTEVCGLIHHSRRSDLTWNHAGATTSTSAAEVANFWTSGEGFDTASPEELRSRDIPKYVFDHAPMVHLSSAEKYWPADIADHLAHTSPRVDSCHVQSMTDPANGSQVSDPKQYRDGLCVHLRSNENVGQGPRWLQAVGGIPASEPEARLRAEVSYPDTAAQDVPSGPNGDDTQSPFFGRSKAPAILIVVPKDEGVLDAFWFFFYSFNLGNKVMNIHFGNHVGDWEHVAMRFVNSTPESVYLSEHNFGDVYSFSALEKYTPRQDKARSLTKEFADLAADTYAERPVIFSATGSHALYAQPGLHPYALPWNLLYDETDRGPLWDLIQNMQAFVYNHTTQLLLASLQSPKAPVEWFRFAGRWGDKCYSLDDPRQYRLFGRYLCAEGPRGPKFKDLGRQEVYPGRWRQIKQELDVAR